MATTGAGSKTEQPVLLGRVSGLYGVKGWVRVFSYTDPREAILQYKECLVHLEGQWRPVRIAEGRRQGKSVVVRIDGATDRDSASELVGADIGVQRHALPELAKARYYWTDLEGLEVRHRDGRSLGTVAHLLETGANDVLVVHGGADGKRELLIPFVPKRVVLDVDLAAGLIDVDWEWG